MHLYMKKPVVIGFYGESKTGKTTLIVEIIKRLTKEGLKIATVKITDKKISIDKEQKDTWKYNNAGSNLVVFSSPIETDFLHFKSLKTDEILKYINKIGKYDIILIEGAHDKNIPKSLAKKMPVVLHKPRSSSSKELRKLAGFIIGEEELGLWARLIEFLKT